MSITLYHNPRCSKSRAALNLLQQRGIVPKVRLYLDDPPTVAEIKQLLELLKIDARSLIRTSEVEYQHAKLANPDLQENELVDAMATMPKLIERPIAICAHRAVIGRPPEAVLGLL